MNYFTVREIRPGLLHIGEASGVHCTLVLGRSKALLFDTGYGICDICQYVRALTSLPLTVVNSHCHLDHSGGNHFFPEVLANPSEQDIYADYQQEKQSLLNRMEKLWKEGKSPRPWPENFDRTGYLTFDPCRFLPLQNRQKFDLGGRLCEIVFLPGHTRGSVVLFDHATGTLLSGDNIAPSVWIMFEHSAPLPEYRRSLEVLKRTFAITGILASHYDRLFPPKLIDDLILCIDTRRENRSLFVHPRKGDKALKHKMYAEGIGYIYLVYPLDDEEPE